MNQTEENILGTESLGRLLFRLSVPSILAQIINVLYNMVDRAYIGHIPEIGAVALTGVGVTMPILTAISAFAALVAMGSAPMAGIKLGRKEEDEAEKILGGSLFCLLVVAAVLTLTVELFGKQILLLFGASENTIPYAMDYIRIYAAGTAFVQLTLGMNAFITTQGYAKVSMLTVSIGAVLNIILDPILIFGLGLDVRGAAIATVLSQGISCIWVMRFLRSKKSGLRIKKKNICFDKRIMLPCIALGLSPFIMQFTESVLTVCFNFSLLKYGGDLAVGAMTILASVMQFSMLPLQGLTQGAQPIISYNFGAGNVERVKKTFWLLLICCVSFSMVIWSVAMFTPQIFVKIFANTPELVNYSVWALRIYMAVCGIFGIQIACQQCFVAMGNAKTSMFLALLRKVFLLIPLIFALPYFFADQAMAVFLAEPVADTLAVTTTSVMFARYYKKLNKGVDRR